MTGVHRGEEVYGVRWAPGGKEVRLDQGMTLNAEGEIVPKSPRRGYLPQAVTGESLVPQKSSIKRAASKGEAVPGVDERQDLAAKISRSLRAWQQ